MTEGVMECVTEGVMECVTEGVTEKGVEVAVCAALLCARAQPLGGACREVAPPDGCTAALARCEASTLRA